MNCHAMTTKNQEQKHVTFQARIADRQLNMQHIKIALKQLDTKNG